MYYKCDFYNSLSTWYKPEYFQYGDYGERYDSKPIFIGISNTYNMKIVLIRNDRILRAYHEPREVIVHPKTNQVEIVDSRDRTLEKYELIKRDLGWTENKETDTSEIVLTLIIGKIIS